MHYTRPPRKAYAVAKCGRDQNTVPEPEFGCIRWTREPGSDDEPECIDPAGERHRPGEGLWSRSRSLSESAASNK